MIERLSSESEIAVMGNKIPEKNWESERPLEGKEAPFLKDFIDADSDVSEHLEGKRPLDEGPVLAGENDDFYKKAEKESVESNLESTVEEYFLDLHSKSEYPETIPEHPFETSELEKLSPEEVAEKRDEFDDKKTELKRQWEEENGCPWPKYEKDIYSSNGKLIRKEGSDYDAHHIQPLAMNGKNEVSNITPLSAEVHYDKQGVHSPDSPYSKMDKILGGIEE